MKTLVYIPGIGDDALLERQRRWIERRGPRIGWERVEFFDTRWETDEPYDEKWDRFSDLLDTVDQEETTILAISAGASLMVRALHEYPDLHRGVSFCGAVRNSHTMQDKYKKRAPALYDSIVASENLVTKPAFRGKVQVYRPVYDAMVAPESMLIDAAKHIRVPLPGHVFSIAMLLGLSLPKPSV